VLDAGDASTLPFGQRVAAYGTVNDDAQHDALSNIKIPLGL
jgi:hypothetical protein